MGSAEQRRKKYAGLLFWIATGLRCVCTCEPPLFGTIGPACLKTQLAGLCVCVLTYATLGNKHQNQDHISMKIGLTWDSDYGLLHANVALTLVFVAKSVSSRNTNTHSACLYSLPAGACLSFPDLLVTEADKSQYVQPRAGLMCLHGHLTWYTKG